MAALLFLAAYSLICQEFLLEPSRALLRENAKSLILRENLVEPQSDGLSSIDLLMKSVMRCAHASASPASLS